MRVPFVVTVVGVMEGMALAVVEGVGPHRGVTLVEVHTKLLIAVDQIPLDKLALISVDATTVEKMVTLLESVHRPRAVARDCLKARDMAMWAVAQGPARKIMPPDEAVSKLEDETVGNPMKNLSINPRTYPSRPAYGSEGTHDIVLRTNYFNILPCSEDLLLYRYDLSVVPEEKQPRRRKRIVELLIREGVFHEQNIPVGKIATDWRTTIITTQALDFGTDNNIVRVVRYYEAEENGPPSGEAATRPRNIPSVTIHKGEVLSIKDLMDWLISADGRAQDDNNKRIVHALNIVMSRYPSFTPGVAVSNSNNKYFPPAQGYDLNGGLIALFGFYSSVRTATSRLLLNVNTVTAAFYQAGKLLDLIDRWSRFHGRVGLEKLEQFLKGVRVELLHLKSKKDNGVRKIKTIYGLVRNGNQIGVNAANARFDYAEAEGGRTERITVQEFYKRKHKMLLVRPTEPLVNVGNGANVIMIPPECCIVLPGQLARFKLVSDQTAAMIRVAARVPRTNFELICGEGARVLGLGDSEGPGNFGLKITPEMITVRGRLLAPPQLKYAQGQVLNPDGGQWNMMKVRFVKGGELRTWTYLHIRGTNDDLLDGNRITSTIKQLSSMMAKSGVTVSPFKHLANHVLVAPTGVDYESIICRRLTDIKNLVKGLQMLFIIVPDKINNVGIYNAIKRYADLRGGFQTVCMKYGKITPEKGLVGYCANIALKVNLKQGGTNYLATAGALGIGEANTMLLGIDVTHPPPKSDETAPSIAACVANTDSTCGRWLGSIGLQANRVEMVENLTEMVVERLKKWEDCNRGAGLPTRIIVYRDGVSEDQYQEVLSVEAKAITKALEYYGKKQPKPKISIIIVGKRHHTRFFPTCREDQSRSGNPKNGLIVDRGITSNHLWDFYIQAQDAIQGTARPIHYIVIKDDNNLEVNALQRMVRNCSG
ncbi:hypothetical protein MMC18_006559 [Xylographa bjoerkii]|nr:hypothetical protein [Xylographa bjoerkii]